MLKVKFVILLTAAIFISSSQSMKSRFKSVKCIPLNKTILEVRYCFVKAYSRNYASINFGLTRTVPITRPYDMTLIIQYRYGTIFREVMHHGFEWCSAVDGTTKNLVAKAVAAFLRNSDSGGFNACPIAAGNFDRVNFTFNDNVWPSPMPTGLYRFALTHGKIWILQFDLDVLSDIKTSF